MRYIYHSLKILEHLSKCNDVEKNIIVELGAGYGGLFLAINVFAKK